MAVDTRAFLSGDANRWSPFFDGQVIMQIDGLLVKYKGYELERVRLNDKKLLFISVNS
jgi:hypothetical protein